MPETKQDTEYQAYLDHRSELNKGELEVSGRYDQWILTLSGGALGISIAFIEKVAPSPAAWTLAFIGIAWLVLISAIVCALVSLLTSQSAYRRERDILDDELGVKDPPEKKNAPAKATHALNVWAMALFAVGVVFLCLFSVFNLPTSTKGKEADVAEKGKSNKGTPSNITTHGAVPLKAPKARPAPAVPKGGKK